MKERKLRGDYETDVCKCDSLVRHIADVYAIMIIVSNVHPLILVCIPHTFIADLAISNFSLSVMFLWLDLISSDLKQSAVFVCQGV